MSQKYISVEGYEKEFLKGFQELCYTRSSWQVWADLISMYACTISNAVDHLPEHFGAREEEYMRHSKEIGDTEIPIQLFLCIVNALERNPEQDFLGRLYMTLGLGSHWKGQFFTPYSVCQAMSGMSASAEEADRLITEQGYISICDPACGAGATLIAARGVVQNCRHNYQDHVMFIGQDIDRVTGLMCYIQLSLLGCPGYVCIGDAIANPLTGNGALFPVEKKGQELWYTPMFLSSVWSGRRWAYGMDRILNAGDQNKLQKSQSD